MTDLPDPGLTSDPTRYAWFAGSILVCGTLDTYARVWTDRRPSGAEESMSREITMWPHPEMEPRKVPVDITHTHTDDKLRVHYKFSVPGDVAWASIDGRA